MYREEEIRQRIMGKDWLVLINTSVHDIPERLREYDSDMFVVWNIKKQQYEIHTLANIGDTFGVHLPFGALDARAIETVKRMDARTRGAENIIKEMDKYNDELTERERRRRSNDVNAIAREMAPAFRKLAWEGV